MVPPPVTPSPHRFVIKEEAPVRRSTLSQQPQLQQTPRPSTQQFNTTRRFNLSSTPRPTPSQSLPRVTPSAAAKYQTPAPKQYDAIDESSDDILGDVHDSIATEEQGIDYENDFSDDGDAYKIEERSPKRRRLSTSSIISQEEHQQFPPEHPANGDEHHFEPSSSLPILSSPPIPTTKRPQTTAPKFLPPTPAPASTPLPSTTTTFSKPPRFRPPSPSQNLQSANDPLPEHFSPHRKGQKYIHGGLAAEVRDWLFNLPTLNIKSKMDGKEEWLVRIVVDEVSGSGRSGFMMVRGRQVHAVDGAGEGGIVDTVGEVKVLLAGEGQANGLQRGSKVEVGKRVGIKGPVWEVAVEGERWGVGVDWKVLN